MIEQLAKSVSIAIQSALDHQLTTDEINRLYRLNKDTTEALINLRNKAYEIRDEAAKREDTSKSTREEQKIVYGTKGLGKTKIPELREPPSIPPNITYHPGKDVFYKIDSLKILSKDFWMMWYHRRHEFPQTTQIDISNGQT